MLSAGTALGSKGHHPDVISISLGICEPMYSGHLVYRRAMDSIFAVAAGAGISTLVAAGDTGSSGCRINAQTGTTALPLRTVSLPSSSPYVTAVGGTNLRLNAEQPDPLGDRLERLARPRRRRWRRRQPALAAAALVAAAAGAAAVRDRSHRPRHRRPRRRLPRLRLLLHLARMRGTSPAREPRLDLDRRHQRGDAADGRWGRPRRPVRAPARGSAGWGSSTRCSTGSAPRQAAGRRVFRDVTRGDNDLGALLPQDVGGGHPLGCCAPGPAMTGPAAGDR